MVIGKSTLSLPHTTLSGFKPMPVTVGVWRYGEDGIIEEAEYNYDDRKLGPYTFTDPYGYVPRYYSMKPTPPIRLLYSHMLETRTALGAYFVNNTYVAMLYADGIKYLGIGDEYVDFRPHKEPVQGIKEVMNCGFVKTYLVCADVARTAYKLQMDMDTGLVYLGNGKWVEPPEFPNLGADLTYGLYKKLTERPNVSAVFLNSKNEEVYF